MAMIRPFEFPDLPALHRYRHKGVFLDTQATLTWGEGLVPARAVFSPISEALGVFTGIYRPDKGRSRVIGQVRHALGAPQARFTFLAPSTGLDPTGLAALVEHLIIRLGEREAQALVADVDERSEVFEELRRLSFSIYARQHIWRLSSLPRKRRSSFGWREIIAADEFNARKLYYAVVPALVQQVEPTPWEELRGWVFHQQGEMLAYADVVEGPRGVWVQPFIHPEMEDAALHLEGLLASLKPRERRPVFVCLRSYQAGLSYLMEEIGAQVSNTQAVMVRRLTAAVKKPELAPLPAINGKTEPTTPFTNASDHEAG